MKCYKNIIVIICFFVFACVKVAWAQVESGTTYNVSSSSCPTGWEISVPGTSGYAQLIQSTKYIKTSTFCQNGFTSIVLKARTYGGPSDSQKLITVSWYDETTNTETVLGTIAPSNNELNNYTINSPTNPTANTTGYIKIQCKGASSSKGSGVSQVTINFTSCGVTHTLSSAVDPAGSGSVSPSSTTLSEGGTTEVTATANTGYSFTGWTIAGTGASLSSTSANPTEVTMGTADATVTAHFTALSAYTVTFNAGTGTCATASLPESVAGAGVVLPSATAPTGCDPEYHFYGWATSLVGETSTPPAIVGAAGDTYHPAANTTLFAVYVAGGYQKVTSAPSDWSGTYLIVYEDGSKAFNGSLATLDAANNNISVTIVANIIASNPTTDAFSFVIAKSGENYTIKSSSGNYIGRTANSNGLDASTGTAYTNTISYNAGNVDIVSSGGAYLRFNNGDGQKRFRFFKSDTYTAQQAIQLYRRIGASSFCSNPSCSCPSPSNFAASSITSSTAYLSWTANGTESRWQVVVSETELGDPSTETMHLVGATNYTAMSLSPLTTYYAYVRAKCDEDDFSGWIMVSFSTPCDDWGVSFAMLPTTDTLLEPAATLNLSVRGNASGRAVEWSSSNTDVATVTNTGVVTAVAEGYCVIRATVPADGTSCGKTVSCNIAVSADECARVGWGEAVGVGIYTASNYSYTQQLYTAEEIRMAGGRAGKITSIKVHHRGTNSVTSKIFLGMTSKASLKVEWETNGLQMVKNATINYIDGWTEISLTTPFEWDGESNIVVAFQNTSGTGANCYTHLLGNSGYAQSYTYNYRSHSSSSAIEYENEIPVGVVGAEFANRTNMKFCIERCSVPVDAYFSTDELSMTLSSSLNLATLLTVNPTGGVVTYTSSNTSIATVTSSGVVTASSSNEGTAVITAHVAETAGGNCSANASIRVKVCDCASGDSQYAIGAGTESSREYGPLNAYYKYSYRQIIYPADELVLGTINSIAFHYASSNEITRNIVVYMGLTNKTKFDGPTNWISGLTEVYNGTMTCSQPGWVKINLGTPFNYNDGCKNLVIAIDDNTGSYITSSCAFYYSKNSANNIVQLLYDSDGTDYNPLTLTTGASAQRREYPNIKFCMAESSSSSHTLSYDVAGNCTSGTNPLSIASVTATAATVTSIVPSCPNYAGFKEWNTAADGTGKAYHAGDRISLVCENITLHAIYANEVQGESSCENAVAFCNSTNSISFAVEEGVGESYGNFCAFFNSPGTWWYMQIAEPGDLYMTIESHPEDGSRGDVDFACWGPFDNKTCNLSDLNDNGIAGWYHYTNAPGDASKHYINSSDAQEEEFSNPICTDVTLARPSGNLIDYGGSTSKIEYLQIVGAQRGDYYMLLVANYSNCNGEITFTQTGGAGRASCDIVNNCDITSISANTECTNSYSYKVSGEVSFRDAPTDGTLTVALGSNTLTFTPPFASPIAYEFTGLTPNGASMNITATFESSTVNCSKTSSYMAPTKDYCKEVFLPITLVRLRGECNGKRVLISWTTASEHNNDYFVVERSDDAVNFVEVGRVAGAGNSIEMLSYNYADYSIRTGDNYYRLTQVDYDGTRTTSEIIEVHCSGNVPLGDPDVYVYPNPFGDELTVHLVNFGDVAAHIQVYDMLGRMLFERTADDTEVVLQLGALPDAAYTVRVSTADFVVNKKVVKNK